MPPETRICQNCKKEFVIEPEDFKFYEKIKVPPPTWCPECRMVRRMMFRNERALYKRQCNLCHRETISRYSLNSPFLIYDHGCWWSDKWDPMGYSLGYNFLNPFFSQFHELLLMIPQYATFNKQSVNCDYCSMVYNSKNCYLSIVNSGENCAYVHGYKVKDSLDIFWGLNLELCYQCTNVSDSNRIFFSQDVDNSSFASFIYDSRNVQNCLACAGLRNKQYHIFNKPYSQEDYNQELKNYDLGSYKNLLEIMKKFEDLKLSLPHRFAYVVHSQNVTGNYIRNSKNCLFCFDTARGLENGKYLAIAGLNLKDSYDMYDGGTNSQFLYEGEDIGTNSNSIFFSSGVGEGLDVRYSKDCFNCSHIFGCIGLLNKSYCILNKQYTKEEYERMAPRIIEHMNSMPYIDKKGRVYKYGEFFPPELSPFSYNETIAQEYFPLTKKEALEKGYSWKDPEPRNYQVTMTTEQIPDHIKDVHDPILNDIIQCAHWPLGGLTAKCNEQCTQAFRIIPQELAFLKRMNLPLPRLCPNCRHYQRIKQRNPLKLWHRKCNCHGEYGISDLGRLDNYKNTADHIHHKKDEACPNEFETTYSPERPEIVYCENCYLREVV